jgi:hypothetical protein
MLSHPHGSCPLMSWQAIHESTELLTEVTEALVMWWGRRGMAAS